MSSSVLAQTRRMDWRSLLNRTLDILSMPFISLLFAFVGGALIIWVTSGKLDTVGAAYAGLVEGALFKTRGLSESIVATVPYILLSLGLAIGFKSGLFNIGVEGQFYMGAVAGAWAGITFVGLPAIILLPLTLFCAALAGAIWAGIPGILKARTGAHEVITTMMMNYIAFRLTEYLINYPLRDTHSSAVQTPHVDANAELWSMYQVPQRLSDPLNALLVAIVFAFVAMILARWLAGRSPLAVRLTTNTARWLAYVGTGIIIGLVAFFALPPLTQAVWPFTDQYDRLHIGIFLAVGMAVLVWWLLWRTTLGFEMRTVGANPDAAKYAGINITRTIVISMALSGAFAGLAGVIEVLGVSTCRCLPVFFSSGYGFDSIAIALLARNDPFGIIASSFLFGAMRNGSDFMELASGVSKYVISIIQALALLFIATPLMVRFLLRRRQARVGEEQAPLTRGWGS